MNINSEENYEKRMKGHLYNQILKIHYKTDKNKKKSTLTYEKSDQSVDMMWKSRNQAQVYKKI